MCRDLDQVQNFNYDSAWSENDLSVRNTFSPTYMYKEQYLKFGWRLITTPLLHYMPLGWGQGQNVGLKDFARGGGHPCLTNTSCLISCLHMQEIKCIEIKLECTENNETRAGNSCKKFTISSHFTQNISERK